MESSLVRGAQVKAEGVETHNAAAAWMDTHWFRPKGKAQAHRGYPR
jgi:hypothetical protein